MSKLHTIDYRGVQILVDLEKNQAWSETTGWDFYSTFRLHDLLHLVDERRDREKELD